MAFAVVVGTDNAAEITECDLGTDASGRGDPSQRRASSCAAPQHWAATALGCHSTGLPRHWAEPIGDCVGLPLSAPHSLGHAACAAERFGADRTGGTRSGRHAASSTRGGTREYPAVSTREALDMHTSPYMLRGGLFATGRRCVLLDVVRLGCKVGGPCMPGRYTPSWVAMPTRLMEVRAFFP